MSGSIFYRENSEQINVFLSRLIQFMHGLRSKYIQNGLATEIYQCVCVDEHNAYLVVLLRLCNIKYCRVSKQVDGRQRKRPKIQKRGKNQVTGPHTHTHPLQNHLKMLSTSYQYIFIHVFFSSSSPSV